MKLTLKCSRTLTPADLMFGGIWIGPGGGDHGDGNRPDPGQANADATVRAALEAGIVEFDTAPWYGSGASEERLGRALRSAGGSGAAVITKAGRLLVDPSGAPALAGFDAPGMPPITARRVRNDYTAQGADASLSQSLDRMGLEGVYGLRIHDPNDNSLNQVGREGFTDEVAIALGQTPSDRTGMCARLAQLRAAGTIQHVGLGMNCNEEAHQGAPGEALRLLRGTPAGTFDSALLAGGWNLLSQAGAECFAECEASGVAVHVAGVFGSGLLVDPTSTYAYRAAPPEVQYRAFRWGALAGFHGCSLPAVAIAFAAAPTCVKRVVIGMATPQQVEQNLAWVRESASIPAALWADAFRLGLLPMDLSKPCIWVGKKPRRRKMRIALLFAVGLLLKRRNRKDK